MVVVGGGGRSEKETTSGRKNGLQAKQSAQEPITHPEAAAIPYKACTHKLTLVGLHAARTDNNQQMAHTKQSHMLHIVVEQRF